MELSGDLTDFALTDILQILSLSKKTGTLVLEAGEYKGRLVIEQGCITHASLAPGDTLLDRLVQARLVDERVWSELKRIGDCDDGMWPLDTLLIESGILKRKEFERLARRYIEDVVASLISLGKGRFWIELNHVNLEFPSSEIRLTEGLEVEEVLLEVAHTTDEVNYRASDNASSGYWKKEEPAALEIGEQESESGVNGGLHLLIMNPELSAGGNGKKGRRGIQGGSRLCSLLMEMKSHSFEAEVSLLIMRFASEVASRGMLFVVRDGEVNGLGQFGIASGRDSRNPDQVVRNIRIKLGQGSIFDSVINSGQPYIGELPEDPWVIDLLSTIGGVNIDLSLFLLPLMCHGRTAFLIYGDNYPDCEELEYIDELIALTIQASIVLEKIVLEKIVGESQCRA